MEHTLRQLLERALAARMRVAVRGTDEERLREIDDALWAVPEESFLPHAMAGGGRDARPAGDPDHELGRQRRHLPDVRPRCRDRGRRGGGDGARVHPVRRARRRGGSPTPRGQWKRLTGDGRGRAVLVRGGGGALGQEGRGGGLGANLAGPPPSSARRRAARPAIRAPWRSGSTEVGGASQGRRHGLARRRRGPMARSGGRRGRVAPSAPSPAGRPRSRCGQSAPGSACRGASRRGRRRSRPRARRGPRTPPSRTSSSVTLATCTGPFAVSASPVVDQPVEIEPGALRVVVAQHHVAGAGVHHEAHRGAVDVERHVVVPHRGRAAPRRAPRRRTGAGPRRRGCRPTARSPRSRPRRSAPTRPRAGPPVRNRWRLATRK